MSRQVEKRALAFLDQLANASGKTVDTVYATLVHKLGLKQPFFKAGWGDLQVVNFHNDAELLYNWPPDHFDVKIEWQKVREGTKYGTAYELLEGKFRTPCQGAVYDALPEISRTTHVQLLKPKRTSHQHSCVVHLAGTGDHGFERRIRLGAPLLEKGIASLALESPYYGRRRPSDQEGSSLLRVSDLLVLGRATIEESLCLLEWAARQGFGKLGMSGFSMGGVHASMVASLYPKPVACTPLLAPRSASVSFCKGALRDATAWRVLTNPEDEKHQDVLKTVLAASQPTAVTSAAVHVPSSPSTAHSNSYFSRDDHPVASNPQDKTRAEKYTSALPSPSRDAEGISIAAHELKTPDEKAASTSSSFLSGSEREDSARHSSGGSATTSYGSAAAYLGFRLPGWVKGGDKALFSGLSLVERQLSQLWAQKPAHQEARHRLEQVLETYTDVTRFPCPKAPEAAVIVGALEDAYVAPESIRELAGHWPGSEVRWVPGGHVSAFLLQQPTFRTAISDSLDRLKPESSS